MDKHDIFTKLMAAADNCNSQAGIQQIRAAPVNYLLLSLAHFWLPTVHDVLHADWHEAWHLPHPPFLAVALKSALLIVLICFITNPPFIIYTNIKIISYLKKITTFYLKTTNII